MKISSASKKVLASALSAAMVVAFAPTVAFGAQADGDAAIKVTYDLDGGTDSGVSGTQYLQTGEVDAVITGTNAWDEADIDASVTLAAAAGDATPQEDDFKAPASFTATSGEAVWARVDGDKAVKIGTANADISAGDLADADVTVTWSYGTAKKSVKDVASKREAYAAVDDANTNVWASAAVANAKITAASPAAAAVTTWDVRDTNDTTIAIQQVGNNGAKKQLTKGNYQFDHWVYSFDANGDGDYDDANDVKEATVTGDAIDVSAAKYGNGSKIYVKAVYAAPSISAASFSFAQKSTTQSLLGQATIKPSVTVGTDKADASLTYTATLDKDGSEIASKSVGMGGSVSFDEIAVDAGTYTVTLKDSAGNVLSTEKELIGAVKISGGYYKNRANDSLNVAGQTVYYEASADQGTTYQQIFAGATGVDVVADKDGVRPASGNTDLATKIYAADGVVAANISDTSVTGTSAKTKKGAVVTELSSFFGDDSIVAATQVDGTFSVSTYTAGASYYLTVADPSGKIVKENSALLSGVQGFKAIDTDTANDFATAFSSGATTFTIDLTKGLTAGDYTVSLYKVTAGTATTDATVELVESKAVAVATAAAPTWAYTANADVTKGGTLVLTNNAGDTYDVLFGTGSATSKYNAAGTGIAVNSFAGKYVFKAAKNSKAKDTDPSGSTEVTIWGYNQAGALVDLTAFADNGAALVPVNGSKTVYYGQVDSVKAAIAAAKKTFTDKGFAEGDDAAKAWAETLKSAEKSVLTAVADAAKAEVAKYYAGITNADGTLTKVSDDNNAKAIAAVDAVLAAFDANSDGDISNNVAKINGVNIYGGASYAQAVDAALKAAADAAVTYTKADADAAKAVVAAGQSLVKAADVTAANAKESKAAAEAVVKAYEGLSATQKQIVDGAVYENAKAVVAAADAAIAKADKAALAKVKGKTVKAKAKKKTTAKLTVVTSKSGSKSTFKKASGNAKITVSKAGKVTVKKGLKAGKTYTAKVKATVGTQSKTVKVTVKVSK